MPLLDTKLLTRLASGRKQETYFPVAVADGKFHCIILKGGERYPYFPRPLLSEFEFCIPLSSRRKRARGRAGREGEGRDGDEGMEGEGQGEGEGQRRQADDVDGDEDGEDDRAETRKLEQQFMLKGVQAAQLRDLVAAKSGGQLQRSQLSRTELDMDKVLLQLLAVECREGEERGMRALEMVELMCDRTGRMMEAAGKVAERYGRSVLGDKIRAVGERRAGGEGGDDEDDG